VKRHTFKEGAAICHRIRTREIIWTTDPVAPQRLKEQGFHLLQYSQTKNRIMASRSAGASRSSLHNPAEKILSLFQKHEKIAVVGAQCGHLEDLQIIYGYLVEPSFQWACTIMICADKSLQSIAALDRNPAFHDPQWRYPWTIERLVCITGQGQRPTQVPILPFANRWRQFWNKLSPGKGSKLKAPPGTRLDDEQIKAVNAGDGVVQIIAPAGSGKTTVLIERVKELQKRGTPANRILCMSFNRDAMVEIGDRLVRAGVEGVVVRSFHGMGLAILKKEGQLRSNIGGLDDHRLDQLIHQAKAMVATKTEVQPRKEQYKISDARNAISGFKLASMLAPDEALAQAENGSEKNKVFARIFDLYQRELARNNTLDFDDLVAKSVTLLQTNQAIRRHWQQQFDRVLVDEYQDIEPSQALLVGILAAPRDSLFCVGDEDQCIYAWRRATVQRIIELDQVYPGLERHALIRNYRCGRHITKASRRLVQHNRLRFRKPLHAGSGNEGHIVAVTCQSREAGADLVAHLVSDATDDETVVLARTSRLLEEVKTACLAYNGNEPTVELATIHASKGREWDRVILFAVDEGQTPHAQAVAEGGLEDERRLFYVALTRAKLRLEIIATQDTESRFLKEAGIVTSPAVVPLRQQ
jgi:superfamily I DNA/RNA helicase